MMSKKKKLYKWVDLIYIQILEINVPNDMLWINFNAPSWMCRHLIKFILKVMKREFCIVWTATKKFSFRKFKTRKCLDAEV